ncbi:Inositol-1-monophosphatase [Austwickia sp. TVS 96-490-7B]|uniref:inositol monophosphatase family protein n=1 Tax=Austwickia sp. TVS 96-490-7B TaxID=2830843 RepID=UPI001C5A42A6|nr:inositol monophosphatase family protein [Austwickia sp. TVS 96-490-7B]MBW3086865.1 Inositol-1-monophosphatase [Austwickia sp. TVS 96-490-7B]
MDTQAVLDLMKDVAAQVITPRFRSLTSGEVMEKNPGDLVTVADREAEVLLTQALTADDPTVLVVGEEATSADRALLDRLADADHAYTVDPVDGTKNFVHGRAEHAVMVSELRHGEVVRGWIWQPELGSAYVVERGAGAYRDGQRLHPPCPADQDYGLTDLRVLTSRPASEGTYGDLAVGPTAWCCGVDYPWLITGVAHAVMYTNSYPWDHGPGSLFVEELGGVIRRPDRSRYLTRHYHPSGLLVAMSPHIWDTIATHLDGTLR